MTHPTYTLLQTMYDEMNRKILPVATTTYIGTYVYRAVCLYSSMANFWKIGFRTEVSAQF